MRQVLAILTLYQAQLPLTLRQIFYRLVAEYGYPKTRKAYNALASMLGRARRARWPTNEGMWLFEAIRDDSFTMERPFSYQDEANFFRITESQAKRLRLDRMIGQPRRLVIWCEAAGMIPQMRTVANPYGIQACCSGGFDKVTGKHLTGEQFGRFGPVTVLHIGDHDPAGVQIFETLASDVIAFAEHYSELYNDTPADIEFVRLAVTPEQAAEHDLPQSLTPRRSDDRNLRFDRYVSRHSSYEGEVYTPIYDQRASWQAEALDPATPSRHH